MIPTVKQQVFWKEWRGLCDLQDSETVVNLLVFVQIFERTFRCKEPVFFEVKLKISNALIGVSESPPSKTSWEWVMKAENICMPGTQMTLSLIGKGLVLERSTPQTKDKQVPGMFNPKYGEKLSPFAGLHLLSSLFPVAFLLRVYVQWFWPYHFGHWHGALLRVLLQQNNLRKTNRSYPFPRLGKWIAHIPQLGYVKLYISLKKVISNKD